MTMDEVAAEIAALLKKATAPERHKVSRYDHGGGRVYIDGDGPKYEGRELIADFYDEAEREAWIALRNHAGSLLSERAILREIASCAEVVAGEMRRKGWLQCDLFTALADLAAFDAKEGR